ncbi:related to POP7 Nuclear RNase P subunit [Phialocephala subalpina]|uniref:Related to POP7 Nuclear RNase P subunit n=1 Tax=Phialocephala subalpina TaxID=576137 RepID=A0A1L7X1I1_9HELO|nr:related to POP7 Nuclear RNase P subunit [Phialocephala subalpina]
MAKEVPAEMKSPGHKKLPKLPSNQKIQKRPLLHAPITAPRRGASSPKEVYISTTTPFIATVKRVQKLLSHIEDRAAGPLSISGGDKKLLKNIKAGIEGKDDAKRKAREEEVTMKATGKAVEKLLRLAIWWQGQEGVIVRIRTGSVGAVDDVVERGDDDGEGIVEGSRVRRTSCLEVGVRLR